MSEDNNILLFFIISVLFVVVLPEFFKIVDLGPEFRPSFVRRKWEIPSFKKLPRVWPWGMVRVEID